MGEEKNVQTGEKKNVQIMGEVTKVEVSSLNLATGEIVKRTLTEKEMKDYLTDHKLPKVKVAKQEGGNDSTEN